ncbi:MAG TPA: hypothetical protein VH253_07585 [Phycisphaerae bacterium]|nr:hypothetical protein [Phycisphaerae bacterium]
MPLDALCTACDKNYRVSRKLGGKTVKCPACGGPIKVPLAPAAPALAAAPAKRAASPAKRAAIPTPPPEPDPLAGDYDLAALAAAEDNAAPLQDRIYVPTPVVEAPPPPDTSRFVRVKTTASRNSSGSLSFAGLFLYSPLFYLQALALILTFLSFAGPPIVGALAFLFVIVLIFITFFVGYLRALILTSKRWPVFGITGIFLPAFWVVTALLGATHMDEQLQTLRQVHAPEIVLILTLITLVGYIIHTIVDFPTMARALIAGCYFILDIFLSIAIAAKLVEILRTLPHH